MYYTVHFSPKVECINVNFRSYSKGFTGHLPMIPVAPFSVNTPIGQEDNIDDGTGNMDTWKI